MTRYKCERADLGCSERITRRDFIDGALKLSALGAVSGPTARRPLSAASPNGLGADWYGYGGVGDYATSHGNTPQVVMDAHSVRDGAWTGDDLRARDTGESYDLVIVGGGMAGLGAALQFLRGSATRSRALLIENHPVPGGESKRNEFIVDGVRLIAPQGANGFSVPDVATGEYADGDARYFEDLRIPREYQYAPWPLHRKPLKFGQDDYGFLFWNEDRVSNGWLMAAPGGGKRWLADPWANNLAETPWSREDRAQILAWRQWSKRLYDGPDFAGWLDSRSYSDLMLHDAGLGRAAVDFADPISAAAAGASAYAVSAYSAYACRLPVANAFSPTGKMPDRHSFPGGNDGFARLFLKRVAPRTLSGGDSFEEVINARLRFAAFDDPGARVRFRLQSTVVRVEHAGKAQTAGVRVTYLRNGVPHSVHSKAVVMATGGWITKHIVRGLPDAHHAAYDGFVHMPCLVANVALRNWRPMYELGITGYRWWGDFGFASVLRRPMWVGDSRSPLDPDRPIVMSFYLPQYTSSMTAHDSAVAGRTQLFTTSFSDFEHRLRALLTELFGGMGFEARRDIAGIILNRWGHAWVMPVPGFYFGRNGAKAGRAVVSEPFGRIAFGHSELNGNQHWGSAAAAGRRAFDDLARSI